MTVTTKIAIAMLAFSAWLAPASEAPAASADPAWQLSATALPTNFAPGSAGEVFLVATNVGGTSTKETITITDTLPVGFAPTLAFGRSNEPGVPAASCAINTVLQAVTCTYSGPIRPGRQLEIRIRVNASLTPGSQLDEASIEGGSAISATTSIALSIDPAPSPFGFLPGFGAPLSEADGGVAAQAGSHPHQLTASLGFPTEANSAGSLGGAGHPRDISIDFPRGEIINPTATPVLCTEAELITEGNPGCPNASQVGTVSAITVAAQPEANTQPLYNMVPPPGAAAMLGFNAVGVGIFVHITGEVRSDGDYGLSGGTDDILALTNHPVFGARVDLWGDPSSSSHDQIRGTCQQSGGTCDVEARKTALLSLPGECLGHPSTTKGQANSWEEPQAFHEASYESADIAGSPVSVTGCNQLEFKPAIEAKPTTNLADAPSGLDFNLHQPQNTKLDSISTAALKDATVTLPEGLVVNPSSANGQGVCDSAQIGLITPIGQAPVHFNKVPANCPDAAKVGTVEITTPLLAQIEESTHKILQDPEGNAIPRPIEGLIYLAKPFDNPFGSLIAIYLAVNDLRSGTVAKFAAKVEPDPVTGRLKSTFTESPELPLEDVRLHFFTGPRASLRTPPACATYTTIADLVPWSAPEGADAHPTDSFAIQAASGGGPCPASADTAPNRPSFVAGALSPQAGAYGPFSLKVAREDGTQELAGFEATLPKGLSAKFAGIPYCSEAAIAQAQQRKKPNEGAIEEASPSCPATSEVGTVDVAAGAGITPLHTTGHIYLAGPYKGAPLSFVIITPAVAGPFDLGVVVVRSAIYVDPDTAQGRAVSDPLPTILDGIPLDVRWASVQIGRPQFTLNPTNCEPKLVLATATSVFGQRAALSNPFQVGGCKALAFKPKLAIRFKGETKRTGHPALTAVATFTPGQANLKQTVVTLPHSEFIDQAHFRTICTRVQFAVNQCPSGSIYGYAKATTPLFDQPLEGPVYLRSSSHKLPDAVIALHGQVDVVLVGRVDSVNGDLRVSFEDIPDAPVTKAVVQMKGGSKGLFINSVNLCKQAPSSARATVKTDGQNGRLHDFRPVVKSDCGKRQKKGHRGHR